MPQSPARAAGPASAYRVLASESRVALLHLLQESARPWTVEELAQAVGLHLNTTREHLQRLVAGGYVERAPEPRRTTRGRPKVLYSAVAAPRGASLDERLRAELLRVVVEGYGRELSPSPAQAAEAAGRAWAQGEAGHADAPEAAHAGAPSAAPADADAAPSDAQSAWRQIAALEVHLEALGLCPRLETPDLRMHLHRCPFEDLAREHQDVVCSVHLGIARGVLAAHGGPVTAERLLPFAGGPHHCVLSLAAPDGALLDADASRAARA